MSGKWKNEEIAEVEVTDKVKWVLQKSTSPEGEVMTGIRKFVKLKDGEWKPTASGLSVKDKAELKLIIELLGKADAAAVKYIIRVKGDPKAYYAGRDGKKVKATTKKSGAKIFDSKDAAKAVREKYGDDTWLVLKVQA